MTEEKKESSEAGLVEVPTQTTIAFKLEDESIVSLNELVFKIYQIVSEIKRKV